jgi:hypothetical protein
VKEDTAAADDRGEKTARCYCVSEMELEMALLPVGGRPKRCSSCKFSFGWVNLSLVRVKDSISTGAERWLQVGRDV